MWNQISTASKIILGAQFLALGYSMSKKAHVTSVVTAMTIGGILIGEWKAFSDRAMIPSTTISGFGELGRLRLVK